METLYLSLFSQFLRYPMHRCIVDHLLEILEFEYSHSMQTFQNNPHIPMSLEDMDPQYPIVTEERKQNFAQLKEQLEKEISEE